MLYWLFVMFNILGYDDHPDIPLPVEHLTTPETLPNEKGLL